MASKSLLSNLPVGGKSSGVPPSPALRISAGFAAFARGNQNASLYEVLGVRSSATCQEIKSAYRRLARDLHPDVAAYSHESSSSSSSSSDEFMRVHAAYATLSDPEKRAVYDGSLFRWRQSVVVSSASGCSALTRRWRNWETDQCW